MGEIQFRNIRQSHMQEVNDKINDILSDCPAVLRPMMEHLKKAGGKNIRAALVLATYGACGEIDDSATSLAAAIELLHLSTLVHDDVIDNAKTRRGVDSLQKRYGKKLAVLSGDFLFTKCFGLVSKKHGTDVENFAKAVSIIVTGEALQHQHNKDYDITEKQYYKIIAGKTAALFALCTYGAAYDANPGDRQTAERLARAGYYMGMVFQMIDDCLDYSGDIRKTKKAVFKDLEEGVATYPLIHTLKQMPQLKKTLRGKMTKDDKALIVKAVRDCGGVEATKDEAKRFYTLSQKYISRAFEHDTEALTEILTLVFDREA